MRGFTLLEVMVALAIMASVILTVLSAVNYQLGIVANERDNTAFTLLAKSKMDEMIFQRKWGKNNGICDGSMAPSYPELTCQSDELVILDTIKKLVVRVRRNSDKREVTLERYLF